MFGNLLVVTLVVVILWVVIIGLFLAITRQQPDVQAQMKSLEEQLDKSESNAGRK